MYDCGDAHCHAKPVMPQSEVRDLDRRKQLDRTCKQRGYEQDNQQPGVGVEPSELLPQGVKMISVAAKVMTNAMPMFAFDFIFKDITNL